jgi:hypothetical protein
MGQHTGVLVGLHWAPPPPRPASPSLSSSDAGDDHADGEQSTYCRNRNWSHWPQLNRDPLCYSHITTIRVPPWQSWELPETGAMSASIRGGE